jgi:hypothetical protein
MKRSIATLCLVALIMFSMFLPASCSDSHAEFAPFKGRRWYTCYRGDTLFLELLSASDVALYSHGVNDLHIAGTYETWRGKFPFSGLSFEIGAVQYNIQYARFEPNLDMVVYGDSMDAVVDTCLIEWNCPFTPIGEYERE